MNSKGFKKNKMPINFDPKQPKVQVKNIDQMPDQKWHRRISFLKSGIRIVGYVFIPFNLIAATALLVVSEVVGIIEELVWKSFYILVPPGAGLVNS